MGEGIDAATRASLQAIAQAEPAVRSLRPPLSVYLGPTKALLALDMRFQQDLTAQQGEAAVGRLEKANRAKHPKLKRIFGEAESFAPE